MYIQWKICNYHPSCRRLSYFLFETHEFPHRPSGFRRTRRGVKNNSQNPEIAWLVVFMHAARVGDGLHAFHFIPSVHSIHKISNFKHKMQRQLWWLREADEDFFISVVNLCVKASISSSDMNAITFHRFVSWMQTNETVTYIEPSIKRLLRAQHKAPGHCMWRIRSNVQENVHMQTLLDNWNAEVSFHCIFRTPSSSFPGSLIAKVYMKMILKIAFTVDTPEDSLGEGVKVISENFKICYKIGSI